MATRRARRSARADELVDVAGRAGAAGRAGSAGRAGAGTMDRLAEVLERALLTPRQPEPRREVFKAPEFDGLGDVDLFIRQFSDVIDANEWGMLPESYTSGRH